MKTSILFSVCKNTGLKRFLQMQRNDIKELGDIKVIDLINMNIAPAVHSVYR